MKDKPVIILFFIILSFLYYGNTLTHEYALDDAIVINQNLFTKNGISGIQDILSYDTFTGFFGKEKKLVEGGRYRPFSLITFAIEYEFFGLSPHISHFINIALYAFTAIMLFLVLSALFAGYRQKYRFLNIPFITTLIFIIHPVHTEVVANIKGRDEILALLAALGAT